MYEAVYINSLVNGMVYLLNSPVGFKKLCFNSCCFVGVGLGCSHILRVITLFAIIITCCTQNKNYVYSILYRLG